MKKTKEKLYVTTSVFRGDDGILLGSLNPSIHATYEGAVEDAQMSSLDEDRDTYLDYVTNSIMEYDDGFQEWKPIGDIPEDDEVGFKYEGCYCIMDKELDV